MLHFLEGPVLRHTTTVLRHGKKKESEKKAQLSVDVRTWNLLKSNALPLELPPRPKLETRYHLSYHRDLNWKVLATFAERYF